MSSVQIVVRDIPVPHLIEEHIRKKAQKLMQYYTDITAFHMVIDVPQKHKRQGRLFTVKMDAHVPGKQLAVSRKSSEDINVVVRDAFDALIRQLESYTRKKRGEVKLHETAMINGFLQP